MAGARRRRPNGAGASMRMQPSGAPLRETASARAWRSSSRIRFARCAKASPAGVARTAWVVRRNRVLPRAFSRLSMRRATADGVSGWRRAAAEKLPHSSTSRKIASWWVSWSGFIAGAFANYAKPLCAVSHFPASGGWLAWPRCNGGTMQFLDFSLNLVLGLLLGTVGGLFGIGGGLIAIPALGILFGLDQQLAQGTALVMVVPNVLLAVWRYHQRNRIDLRYALTLGVTSFLFAVIGAKWAVSQDPGLMRQAFVVFLVLLAAYNLLRIYYRPRAGSTELRYPWPWL